MEPLGNAAGLFVQVARSSWRNIITSTGLITPLLIIGETLSVSDVFRGAFSSLGCGAKR